MCNIMVTYIFVNSKQPLKVMSLKTHFAPDERREMLTFFHLAIHPTKIKCRAGESNADIFHVKHEEVYINYLLSEYFKSLLILTTQCKQLDIDFHSLLLNLSRNIHLYLYEQSIVLTPICNLGSSNERKVEQTYKLIRLVT